MVQGSENPKSEPKSVCLSVCQQLKLLTLTCLHKDAWGAHSRAGCGKSKIFIQKRVGKSRRAAEALSKKQNYRPAPCSSVFSSWQQSLQPRRPGRERWLCSGLPTARRGLYTPLTSRREEPLIGRSSAELQGILGGTDGGYFIQVITAAAGKSRVNFKRNLLQSDDSGFRPRSRRNLCDKTWTIAQIWRGRKMYNCKPFFLQFFTTLWVNVLLDPLLEKSKLLCFF